MTSSASPLMSPPLMSPPAKTSRRSSELLNENEFVLRQLTKQHRTFESSVNERSGLFCLWSLVVSVAVVYNLMAATMLVFEAMRDDYYMSWLLWNGIADLVYALDIVVLSRKSEINSLPGDGFPNLLRCNRFFKAYRLVETFALVERRLRWHFGFSILRIVLVSLLLFHWNACAYYALSVWSVTVRPDMGDSDDWPFTLDRIGETVLAQCGVCYRSGDLFDEGGKNISARVSYADKLHSFWSPDRIFVWPTSHFAKEYAQSMYWSALTMTTLGEQPSPNLSEQNLFEIFDTIIGLLIFAVIMGAVAELIASSNAFKASIQTLVDGLKDFMSYREVEDRMQQRVLLYCHHILQSGILATDEQMRECVPEKLFVRMNSHMQSTAFASSSFFADLERPFLRDLASRLRMQSYGPNDVVTDVGEWNRELYVVCSGRIDVLDSGGERIRDIYGDTTLLWIDGDATGCRRQHRLRAVAFSEVCVLARRSLLTLLDDFPEVRATLVKRAVADLEERRNAHKATARRLQRRRRNAAADTKGQDGNLPAAATELLDGVTLAERIEIVRRRCRAIDELLDDTRTHFNHCVDELKRNVHSLERSVATLTRSS